jgi:hypothetical protein
MKCECGNQIHPERVELGFDYCIKCASHKIYKAPVVIMGQHKGQPLVYSLNDPIIQRRESNYNV